jgi:hypothetical protein
VRRRPNSGWTTPRISLALPIRAFDRHRGGGHPPSPATPPCVRVRTRRFELVALASLNQRWKSERFEVGIRKPREGFSPSQVPRAAPAPAVVASQSRTNSQFQQCGSATAWCFPLPPQGCTQTQPDPTSQIHQHIGRFTETEIAAPAPEIGHQFRDCRFHADAFGPSRGFPDSALKPLQSFRLDHALNLRTGAKAKSEGKCRRKHTVDGSSPQPASKRGDCLREPTSFMLREFATPSANSQAAEPVDEPMPCTPDPRAYG